MAAGQLEILAATYPHGKFDIAAWNIHHFLRKYVFKGSMFQPAILLLYRECNKKPEHFTNYENRFENTWATTQLFQMLFLHQSGQIITFRQPGFP